MAKEKHPTTAVDPPASQEKRSLSRRDFLKASMAGAGALALPHLNLAQSAAAASEKRPEDSLVTSHPVQTPDGDSEPQENWIEPWEHKVSDFGPDDYFQLNVVEHQAPDLVTGGLPAPLFSYNGLGPGPTIRVRGDEILRVQIVNQLSGNNGTYAHKKQSRWVGEGKDPDGTAHTANEIVPDVPDWQLSELVYGPHQQHTTNIHTHGLHVSSHQNDDGTRSDNVLLRIIPQEDFENRHRTKINWPLKAGSQDQEIRKEAKYEFRLGKSSGPDVGTHPPGTHWYHPHPHGATYDQVAGGMAGFLIVEGDVDDVLREQIKGYKERLMLFQRIVAGPAQESEEESGQGKGAKPAFVSVNGRAAGQLVIVMQPGAIERWRVLNGSVDGQGFIEFMVVDGEPPANPQPGTPPSKPKCLPEDATPEQVEKFKQDYEEYQVQQEDYVGQLQAYFEAVEDNDQKLKSLQVVLDQLAFDGITLVSEDGQYTTRRVPSVVLAPANRADFLFQAPKLKPGETSREYWIVANWVPDATDRTNPLQEADPPMVKMAKVIVRGEEVDPGVSRGTDEKLLLDLPPIPRYLEPIQEGELEIENGQGMLRTRQVIYSGWGSSGYPCYQPCQITGEYHPTSEAGNSMMIDGNKFDSAVSAHKMALGSAEEWTLWNYSMTIYEDGGGLHYAETKTPAELVAARQVYSKAADHPFHMHQNPFWVLSITDANGNELLPEARPRWQDVVRIPRNGGRVIFRSRFWDYAGAYVNHCHLLQHEDWGMMQRVEVVADEASADYVPAEGSNVSQWQQPSKADMYEACLGSPSLAAFCSDPYPPPPPR